MNEEDYLMETIGEQMTVVEVPSQRRGKSERICYRWWSGVLVYVMSAQSHKTKCDCLETGMLVV